ncbi:hypothetical protein SDC9_185169 [bioreactor metagenome]|uniref:Uncharacterized protein n=1 Tax=bioreactor metagenome TaxID=1076179 RepID=A0A645HHH4_9ZZZZ
MVGFGNAVDRVHEREEIVLIVYVLLAVRREQDVTLLGQTQPQKHVARQNPFLLRFKHLAHRRAGDEQKLAVEPLGKQVSAGVLRIGQIHVADAVHDHAVDHLRHVPVPAAVARFHMENRNLEPLCRNRRECGVGVPQHEQRIRLFALHHRVGLCDDVSHRFA